MALAFEQQPREGDKAFAAFSLYLSLGPERSLAKVAAKLGKGQRIMETWSKKWFIREVRVLNGEGHRVSERSSVRHAGHRSGAGAFGSCC